VMSSSLPPSPSPLTGAPPSPPAGAPPPSMGTPPPSPPPPSPTETSTANYFFGFVITFVVLLLFFVACGVGSWRRFRLAGTAWDERLQDMEGSSFVGQKRGRRRLIRPVFWETWSRPDGLTPLAPALSEKGKWVGMQPISAAFVWSRSKAGSTLCTRKSRTLMQTPGRRDDGSVLGVGVAWRSYFIPGRPRCDRPLRPPPVERPPPEAIQVAVMIAMPSPPSLPSDPVADGQRCMGQSSVGEYQIGVVRIPWS
ncbi:hypothetical protein J3R82DRAFT_7071, partial [Butyriboletus roseoflavus]